MDTLSSSDSVAPPTRMRLATIAPWLLIWAAALFGTTQLRRVSLPLGGDWICGPWGCAAEPSALLGYHLFWLLLITPAVVLGCLSLPAKRARRVAKSILLLGLAAGTALAVGGAIAWPRDGGELRYATQRALFVVATTPDVPAVHVALAGGVAMAVTRRVGRAGELTSPEPTPSP